MTRWSLLPVLVVVVLYGIVGPTPLAVAIGAAAALSSVGPRRLAWPRATQLLVGVPLFVVAVIAIASFFPQPSGALLELRTPWRAVAGAALSSAVLRLHLDRPAGGEPVTLALGIVALTACGGTLRTDLYPPFVIAFLASAAIARRAADAGSGPLFESLRLRAPAVGALVLVSGAIVASTVVSLPRLHRWTVEKIMRRAQHTTGFSDRMWLGALRGMLESDRRVLRIRGPAGGALLRGVVFDDYTGARWTRTDRFTTVVLPDHPARGSVELEIIDPDPERYFLPSGAGTIAVSTGIARVDAMGVVAPVAADPATHVWYLPAREHGYAIAPPRATDLALPESIAQALRPHAEAFAKDQTSVADKLAAIEEALQAQNHYSLEVPWSGREDPIVAFVREGRGGHCEYFASAMALLARAIGIPARVVGGYRVVEHNAVGGYYLVRERDAHAWVEAWVPGRGWTSFDPTPAVAADGARATTPILSALWDFGGTKWLAFLGWLNRRTPLEMVIPPIALIALAIALRNRRRRRPAPTTEGPPRFFLDVSRALARRGLTREPHETPTALAARARRTLPESLADPVVAWLDDYAAFRYGRRGDEADIAAGAVELTNLLNDAR
jgi:protein-glutamine gamma-glutamyltransferase